jgi:hypothetical protein
MFHFQKDGCVYSYGTACFTHIGIGSLYVEKCVRLNALYWNIRGVSKKFGEWYQKIIKTEDINKLTLFALKIIAILHNTLF